MELNILIEISDTGVVCSATADGGDAFNQVTANTLAVGALEIAKASLLARRWGINVGNFKDAPPLVDDWRNHVAAGRTK